MLVLTVWLVVVPQSAQPTAREEPADRAPVESAPQVRAGVAVVEAAPAQPIDGFGASGAWWPGDIRHFAPTVRQRVTGLLFGSGGLALSIYRYNIGGGGVGDPHRSSPTFLVKPGVYDWSRDPGGMAMLRAAADAGVPSLVGFVNSAPGVWTTTGKPCGGTLTPGREPSFGSYLGDVVRHLHAARGIDLRYVSPMNEPDGSFPGCGQEGMSVGTSRRPGVVRAVADALSAKAPFASVMADVSSHVGTQFMPEMAAWIKAPGAAAAVGALAHHDYDYAPGCVLVVTRRSVLGSSDSARRCGDPDAAAEGRDGDSP